MLEYERKLVDALSTTTDPADRSAVVAWVESSLQAMPEVLRAGVAIGSIVLGVWARALGKRGADLVAALESSSLPPVQMHLRLLRSLVLFGDLELTTSVRS